jgi:hypothetical protein
MKNVPRFAVVPDDDLLNLEIHIARLADALAKGAASDRKTDLAHWLQAERQVFGCSDGAALSVAENPQ